MIELTKHIEHLLLENDCVIVPELGGFIAHHQPAHYEEAEGIFLPPMRGRFQSSAHDERRNAGSILYASLSYRLS